jgi:hypothetical protein
MKTTYFLFVLGLLCAVAYSLPIEEDEPLEDELKEGNIDLKKQFPTWFLTLLKSTEKVDSKF